MLQKIAPHFYRSDLVTSTLNAITQATTNAMAIMDKIGNPAPVDACPEKCLRCVKNDYY